MDGMDRRILSRLRRNGRASAAEISREVHLSVPAVSERIRKLEQLGVIEGYTVRVSRAAEGLGLLAFVQVVIDTRRRWRPFGRRRWRSPACWSATTWPGAATIC